MQKLILLLIVVCSISFVQAQTLQLGGLQGDKTILLTPSGKTNKEIASQSIQKVSYFGFKALEEERYPFQFEPQMPKEWDYLAAMNVPVKGEKINFFYYESWVGTKVRCKTSGRLRSFQNDVTAQVKSNVYHIALQREFGAENETFMILVSPKKQTVIVELPKEVYGTNRRLTYEMEEWEAKFVHIIVPPEEYTVVTWQEHSEVRSQTTLKTGWKFHLGDVAGAEKPSFKETRDWKDVQVPHTWNDMQNMFDVRNIRDTIDVTEMFERNVGWYRKTFTVPADWKEKYIRVNFLAANQVAEVWLNGQYLGKHVGGYTDFHFGINDHTFFDKPNLLAVKVDNRFDYDIPPHTADYNFQGGIYREVELAAWHPVFVKDIHITTPKVSAQKADVSVVTTLRNTSSATQNLQLVVNVINPYNEIAATRIKKVSVPKGEKVKFTQEVKEFEHPLLWGPKTPFQYRIVATLNDPAGQVFDENSAAFGFRFYEFTADRGFFLNGQPLKLQGVNVHQDTYGKGWAMDSSDKRRDYLLMKKMGVNLVRMSHYPHHPYEFYLCDSLGMIVYPEIPVVNTVGQQAFVDNAVKMMEEMILRDKNHPSILMWGVGNEYYRETFTESVVEWALKCTQAVANKAKELGPYRPTIQAQNDLVDERIMQYTDIQGRNRYFGWYSAADVYAGYTTFDGFGKLMDKERKMHPKWKVLVTEYGAEGKYGFHVNNPQRFDHSETYQLLFHKSYWEYIATNDWVLGGTIWNMFDFTSWAKIGNIPHINQKGMCTYDRKPKSIYYYYQSQWTDEPMVYINSHTCIHRSGVKGEKQPLEVFSNCEEVELFLDGVSLGKKAKAKEYRWAATLTEGPHELKAVAHHQGNTLTTQMTIYYHYENPSETEAIEGKDSD
ncbi:MAG: glycoside hydrolase family 2 TIM barrel-domain containing protein [Thermonemataceae bacterium]